MFRHRSRASPAGGETDRPSRAPLRVRRPHRSRDGPAEGADGSAPAAPELLGLQRLVGNAATRALVARSGRPAGAEGARVPPSIQRRITIVGTGAKLDAAGAADLIKGKGTDQEHWKEAYTNVLLALDAANRSFAGEAELLQFLRGYAKSKKQHFEIEIDGVLVYFLDAEEYVDERERVSEVLTEMADEYGIRFSNAQSLKAMAYENEKEIRTWGKEAETEANNIRDKVNKVKGVSVQPQVLEGISDALKRYASVLGDRRRFSPQRMFSQGVTSIGVLSDDPSGAGEGLTSQKYKNIHLYEHALEGAEDGYDFAVKTMIHELSHGLLESWLGEFVRNVTWWASVKSRISSMEILRILDDEGGEVEFPVNTYASSRSEEDLAETARLYLYSTDHHNTLKTDYPEHYAAIRKVVQAALGLSEVAVEAMLVDFEEDVGEDEETQIQKIDVRAFAVRNLAEDKKRAERSLLEKRRTEELIKAEKKEKEVKRLQGLGSLTPKQGKRLSLFTRQAQDARREVAKLDVKIKAIRVDG